MRIIAGTAKGRRIDAPIGMNTRPTLERVKESVFGTIQFDIYGRRVLDLFAGSGNLGIEALSRGAAYVAFCDTDRTCSSLVAENLDKLGFSNADVYNMSYEVLLKKFSVGTERFDLVFLDPPYATGLVQNAICDLCSMGILNSSAIVVAEHDKGQHVSPPAELTLSSYKTYRDTAVTILRKGAKL